MIAAVGLFDRGVQPSDASARSHFQMIKIVLVASALAPGERSLSLFSLGAFHPSPDAA